MLASLRIHRWIASLFAEIFEVTGVIIHATHFAAYDSERLLHNSANFKMSSSIAMQVHQKAILVRQMTRAFKFIGAYQSR